MRTAWLVVGPPDHGVVMLAERLTARLGDADVAVHVETIEELFERRDTWGDVRTAHVHFTDQLFGSDCVAAATAYELLAARLAGRGVTLAVTLHDLPIDPDDPARYQRRADAYCAVVRATTGTVIVSSGHEAAVLAVLNSEAHPVVIPLPIDPIPWPQPSPPPGPVAGNISADVSILGYVYPGKGHDAAIEALSALPAELGLSALGRVAAGHTDLAERLHARAAELGRRLSVTGWIPEAAMPARLRAAGIPLVAHERLSASGSIGSWLSAGRRPLVPDVAYARELAARLPGTLLPYTPTPQGLRAALAQALRDPSSTWLAPHAALGPSTAEVTAAYREAVSMVRYR